MVLRSTIGIHWIVATFGTWLHGDPRGSWRNGKLIDPDPFLENEMRRRMSSDAQSLSQPEVTIVADAFGRTCTEFAHRVFAATIQPTHSQIVFGRIDEPIETTIARLKRRSAASVFRTRRAEGLQTPRHL